MSALIDEEAAMLQDRTGVIVPPPSGPWRLTAPSLAPPVLVWTTARLCLYTLATCGALLVFALGISTHRWNGGWDTNTQPQVGQIVIGAHTTVITVVEQRVLEREPALPCNQTVIVIAAQPPAEAVVVVPPAATTPALSPHWLPPSNRTHVSVLLLCRAAHSIVLDPWFRPQHDASTERLQSCSGDSPNGLLSPAALEPWRTYSPDRDSLCQMNLSWFGIRGPAAPFATLPLLPVHTLVWKVWEADVDVDAGEIVVPLLYLQWKEGQAEGNDIAPSYTHNSILTYAFELLASRGMMVCVIEYSDGRSVTVKPSVVATSGDAVRGVLCPFEPLRRVMAVSVRIDVPADAGAVEWRELHPPSFSPFSDGAAPPLRFGADAESSEFHASFRLLLCHSFQRRVHIAITSRTLYGSTTPLADLMDFVDAHRRIGVDQFVIWDHDRRMWESDQDISSAHWGRLKHAVQAGYLEFDVMPQALGSHQLQVILMYVATLRLKRRANWLLAIDIDEYLVLPPPQQLYPRRCSNSLWCPSPVADWIRTAGLAGYGSVMLDTGHVMGRSMPIPAAVLAEMFPGEQQWRVATQTDQMLKSADPRSKQICPYEPETSELADHLRQWHEERARNSTNNISTCSSLPYVVRYTLGFAPYYQRRLAGTPWNLRKNAGKSMIRLSLLLQPGVHTSSTLRKTRRFDQDRESEAEFWSHAHILHYVDQGGGRTWPIVGDAAKLAEFWSTQPKQYLRHETLTKVQETVPLPPSNNEPAEQQFRCYLLLDACMSADFDLEPGRRLLHGTGASPRVGHHAAAAQGLPPVSMSAPRITPRLSPQSSPLPFRPLSQRTESTLPMRIFLIAGCLLILLGGLCWIQLSGNGVRWTNGHLSLREADGTLAAAAVPAIECPPVPPCPATASTSLSCPPATAAASCPACLATPCPVASCPATPCPEPVACPPAVSCSSCCPACLAAAPSAASPSSVRAVELTSVPSVLTMPLRPWQHAPDGSFEAYLTPLTDAALYPPSNDPALGAVPVPISAVHDVSSRYIMLPTRIRGRWNNQRLALTALLWFARLLRRTILIPAHFVEEFIDWDRLCAVHPCMHMQVAEALEELRNATANPAAMGLQKNSVIYVSRADFEADLTQNAWMQAHADRWTPRFLIDEWGAGSATAAAPVLVMDASFPHPRTLFAGLPGEMFSSLELWVTDALRMAPAIYRMASRAADAIRADRKEEVKASTASSSQPCVSAPLFDASIHWRLSDFVRTAPYKSAAITLESALRWTRVLVDRERARTGSQATLHLYLATESGDPPIIREYRAAVSALGVRVWQWSDVLHLPLLWSYVSLNCYECRLARDESVVGMVEVLLLSQARSHFGTLLSTFSDVVTTTRRSNPRHRAEAWQQSRAWDHDTTSNDQPELEGPGTARAAVYAPEAYRDGTTEALPASASCDPPTLAFFHAFRSKPPSRLTPTAEGLWRASISPWTAL